MGEEVQIRYDPLDLAEIRVFFEDRFVCQAICPELSGQTVSLKEIVAARQAQRRQLRGEIVEREALVKRYVKESMRGERTATQEAEWGKKTQRLEAADPPSVGSPEQEAGVAPKRLRRYRDE